MPRTFWFRKNFLFFGAKISGKLQVFSPGNSCSQTTVPGANDLSYLVVLERVPLSMK